MKSNRTPEARSGASPGVERVPAGPILFIDGHCVLCQRAARWVLRHDRRGRVALAALQGKTAHRLLPAALCEEPTDGRATAADPDRDAAPARQVPASPDRWCGARQMAVSESGRRRCWPSRRRSAAGTGRPRPWSGSCRHPCATPFTWRWPAAGGAGSVPRIAASSRPRRTATGCSTEASADLGGMTSGGSPPAAAGTAPITIEPSCSTTSAPVSREARTPLMGNCGVQGDQQPDGLGGLVIGSCACRAAARFATGR